MIEWLRSASGDPTILLAGRELPIHLKRNPRAKRMILRLSHDSASVQITLPRWGRTAEALAFAENRRDWLEAQLAKAPAPVDPIARGSLNYRGAQVDLHWQEELSRRVTLDGQTISVGGPREAANARLARWLERQCLTISEPDLAHYCAMIGRDPPPLRISRAKRRWGSCSHAGDVRINWRLVMAPDPVRRSVIAHEVAHLVHFDHSPAFHALLDRLFAEEKQGNLAEAQGWLKIHGRSLFAAFG